MKLIISGKKFISCCLSTFVYYYVYSYYCYVFFMYNISSYKCWYFENSQKFLVTTFVRVCAIFYYVLLLLQRFCDFYLLFLVTRTQKPQYLQHYCQIVKSIFNNKCFYFVKCQKSAVFWNLPRKSRARLCKQNKQKTLFDRKLEQTGKTKEIEHYLLP